MFRPEKLDNIIGQEDVINRIKISVNATKERDEVLGHILLDGMPGLGKTSIAQAIANEFDAKLQIANGANLRSIKALLPYLMRIKSSGEFLFIDEVHRISNLVEEFLYPVMEDFRIDLGKEELMTLNCPKFTLIAATTNSGALTQPFYDRFPLKYHLQPYDETDLTEIILANAEKLGLDISRECATIVAHASRNTPRVANVRLSWIRDYAQDKGVSIDKDIIREALKLAGVGEDGSEVNDRKYLKVLRAYGVAGINTLASVTGISRETLENNVEPFLLRKGVIAKTRKGRMLL